MKTNLNIYRTYSSGKLELVRNSIDKEFIETKKKIDTLEDEKEVIKDKIAKIENIVEENIEKKIGKDPSNILSGDRNWNIFFFIYYPLCCYFAYNYVDDFDSIPGAIVIGFVIMIFSMPIALWFMATVLGIFSTIFGISFDKKETDYKKKYKKILLSEKRKQFKGKEKSFNTKIKNIDKRINKLDDDFNFLENLKRELPYLLRRAKQREKTAKIAAFDKKTRDASDTVRKDLVRAVKDKINWKCPYCNLKKNFSDHQTDHIHPVSKGGLAVPENMIPICKQCNQNKKALTLRVFCRKYSFSFNEVCERLEQQGKDI